MLPAFFMLAAMISFCPSGPPSSIGLALSTAILGFAFKRLLVDPMLQARRPAARDRDHGAVDVPEGIGQDLLFRRGFALSLDRAGRRSSHFRRPSPGRTSPCSSSRSPRCPPCNFSSTGPPGRQMQAAAQNPTVARILGVPVERMILYTFLINGALVALASLLISPIYLAKFTNGETLGLAAFIAASSAASTKSPARSPAGSCSALSTIFPPRIYPRNIAARSRWPC